MYGRNQHNIVKQISCNKKVQQKKKEFLTRTYCQKHVRDFKNYI